MEEDAMEVRPVPPYKTEMEVVAPTTPLRASRGPFKLVRVSIPAPSNEEVAVPPKYAVYAERRVEEELVNCWRAVHAFALVKLSASVAFDPPMRAPKEPVVVRVLPESESVVVATLWYVLLPPYTICPEVMVVVPVPPFPMPRVPVTSLTRETVAQVATPAPFSDRTN